MPIKRPRLITRDSHKIFAAASYPPPATITPEVERLLCDFLDDDAWLQPAVLTYRFFEITDSASRDAVRFSLRTATRRLRP